MKISRKIVVAQVLALLASLLVFGPVAVTSTQVQISGNVTTQSGFSIASVTVAVIDASNSTAVASTTTDTSGHYTVPVSSGIYTITATPPAGDNYQTATKKNQSITADTTVNFLFTPVTGMVSLNGQVLDGLGNGVPNQRLSLGGQPVATDATGHYAFQVPPAPIPYRAGNRPWCPRPISRQPMTLPSPD